MRRERWGEELQQQQQQPQPGVLDRTAQAGYSGKEIRKEVWEVGLYRVSEVLQDSASEVVPRQRRQNVQEDH